mgnify:CR=1 FL=1
MFTTACCLRVGVVGLLGAPTGAWLLYSHRLWCLTMSFIAGSLWRLLCACVCVCVRARACMP